MLNRATSTTIISLFFATTAGADTCVLHLYFPFDSAAIDSTASLVMQQFVAYNKGVQTGNVAGFSDKVGTASYNIDLSKRRAQNVVESLRSLSAGRIQLSSAWYGYAHPVVPTPNPEILNRRVEIVADKCTHPWLFNPMPQPLAAYEFLLLSPTKVLPPKGSHLSSGAAYSSDSRPSAPTSVSVTSGPGNASAAVGTQTGNTAAASTDTTGSRAAATSGTTTSSSFAGPTNSSSATSSPGQATAAYAGSTSASAASSTASSAQSAYSGAGSVATSSGGTSVSVGPGGISISRP